MLKLQTPFGGGKSHTLAALLHAAKGREALDAISEGKDFARPGEVAVAVFDGEKFDTHNGKTLDDLPAATAAQAGGSSDGETLPPGVTEGELLASVVGPDLGNITATAVLSEPRNTCLYLHYDGVRYCFKKDPNVTKLIEDAEQEVSREEAQAGGQGPVREKIKELVESRLAGHHAAQVRPAKSHDIPDEEPCFLVAYLPLEFAGENKGEQERKAKELFSKYGDRPRRYRNGLGLAIPEKKQIEAPRRAVRYLLAIERVEDRRHQLRLSKDQLDQLKERKRTEQASVESTFRELYASVGAQGGSRRVGNRKG